MYDLEAEFDRLEEVLKENASRREKNLWQVVYHFWRFYYYMNQNIQNSTSIKKEVEIIDLFIEFHKSRLKHLMGVFEVYDVKDKNIQKIELEKSEQQPYIKEMLQLLEMERETFASNVKRIKKEKEPKKRLKRSSRRAKWVKS